MIAVPINRKIIKINRYSKLQNKFKILRSKLDCLIIKPTVRSCEIYLKNAGNPIKSSTKPTTAKGKQQKGIQNPNNEQVIQVTKTKVTPPPEGIGLE